MDERMVQRVLAYSRKYKAVFKNIYWNDLWEADLIEVQHDYSILEFEVKVSKSDFKADFKKLDKHNHLQHAYDLTMIPNQFAYICPFDLIQADEVPEYAGLMWVMQKGLNKYVKWMKKPPILHTEKPDLEKWRDIAIRLAYKITF